MVETHEEQIRIRVWPSFSAPAFGGAVWVVVAATAMASIVDLSIFQVFLVLGPLVVVPLGLPLVTRRAPDPRLVVGGALLVLAAVLVPTGGVATALTLPWLAVTLLITVVRFDEWRRTDESEVSLQPAQAVATAACIWLVVGAVHLTASRAELALLGVDIQLVELGAMHFSFAGFAAAAIASCVLRHSPRPRLASVAATATIGGAALVGVGHLTIRPLELAGAVSMAGGVTLIGLLSWSLAPRGSAARILLRIAAIGVIVPMAMAVQYAWALTTGTPHLPYATIARIHGSLNAFAFSIGGLLAWRLLVPIGSRSPVSRSGRR